VLKGDRLPVSRDWSHGASYPAKKMSDEIINGAPVQPGAIESPATPRLALTRLEAAKAIGVSAPTIDRLTQRGLLRPSRATRRPLYAVKEIERFLKATTPAAEWEI